MDLAGVDGEGQPVQGVNMTEVLVQAVHFYDVLHVRSVVLLAGLQPLP